MAIVSMFTFSTDGLDISLSSHPTGGTISAYSWNLGDGTAAVTTEDVDHTYAKPGFYTISLSVTNSAGDTATSTKKVGISASGPMMPQSIADTVNFYVPSAVTVDIMNLQVLIQKWQQHLSILVTPNIENVDIYNEFSWPLLVNQLIAELVAFDLVIEGANQFMLTSGTTGSSTSTGQVKKITTGPSDAEWFPNTDLGKIWKDIMQKDGAIDQLKEQICGLASRLRIKLYMCKPLSYSPIVPQKHTAPVDDANLANPFGIMPPLP